MKSEVKVPDIGDFKDVPVVTVHVKAGDVVKVEDPLVTLESDKASIDVPSPFAGRIAEVRVKVGDRVSEGGVLVLLDRADGGAAKAGPASPAAGAPPRASPGAESAPEAADGAAPRPAPGSGPARERAGGSGETSGAPGPQPLATTARFDGTADITCEVLVLGSGPGGYSAAFRAADLGRKTVLVEQYPQLGGVCLNVGCIPSKALLHVAAVMDEVKALARHGVTFGPPQVDRPSLKAFKDKVVGKLTGGLSGMARARKVEVVRGFGTLLDPHHCEVDRTEGPVRQRTGQKTVIRFEQLIIATGSRAVKLPFVPDDQRILDATSALELAVVPRRMLVLGGGIIGLELGTVYSTLGAELDVVELMDGLMPGVDRDLLKVWEKVNRPRFNRVMVKTRAVAMEARADGIYVTFEGEQAPPGPQPYDAVLVAVGRVPDGKSFGAAAAGVRVSERGFVVVDSQMRTSAPHIFAIGDVVGLPMLAHKAVHQGHVAAEAASGLKRHFDARVIPNVAYTDPELAWVGLTETEARAQGQAVKVAVFPWAASGRAIANGRDEGFTKLLFDEATHRVVGGAIVGTHAGDLVSEIALAIELGADAVDIGKTIHPHPTLSESVGFAAEVAEGVCTDLPPPRPRRSAADR